MALATPLRFLCHGRRTLRLASRFGWLPGARYTNLRDIRGFDRIGMIDVEWGSAYSFGKHLEAVRSVRPIITIAQDLEHRKNLSRVLDQARQLGLWASRVVVVPKDMRLTTDLLYLIPEEFLLGYSVPTRYGSTSIPIASFGRRPVHLLGGRPDVQFKLSARLNVFSLDGNRFTLDAAFGDYFNGDHFVPHPRGGYYECIRSSLKAINKMWRGNARFGTTNCGLRKTGRY
jgi:hypothetical protein